MPPPARASPQDGPGDAEPLQAAVDLDDAAVARAVAARHRRLPGELRAGHELANRLEHRLRAAGEHVAGIVRQQLGDEGRLEHDLGVRHERRRLGVMRRCESRGSQADAPSTCERYGSGATPMPPPTSSGRSTSRSKPLPSGPSTCSSSPGPSAQSARVPGPDRVDQERELARRREAERHRARQHAARRLEHEELPRHAGLDPPAATRSNV